MTASLMDNLNVMATTAAGERWEGTTADESRQGTDGNDSYSGGGGNDSLYGSAGHDSLAGGDGDDLLSGGVGNDTLFALAGSDVLRGGRGDDALDSRDAGPDSIDGGDGFDSLTLLRADLDAAVLVSVVQTGVDQSYRFALADGTTVSGIESLHLSTGAGDDVVNFANITRNGEQTWEGGAGTDTGVMDFSGSTGRIFANMRPDGGHAADPDFYHVLWLASVENLVLRGGSAGDEMYVSTAGATLVGNGGDDFFWAEANGYYRLAGGEGNDTLRSDSTSGSTLSGGIGNDELYSAGPGILLGGEGDDVLSAQGPGVLAKGDGGDDGLGYYGFEAAASLCGGAGNDQIDVGGSLVNHLVTGGAGFDSLYLDARESSGAVTVTAEWHGDGARYEIVTDSGTTVRGIESIDLWAGAGDDHVTLAANGQAEEQHFYAGEGNDTLVLDYSTARTGLSLDWNQLLDEAGQAIASFESIEVIVFHGGLGADYVSNIGGDGDDAFFGGRGTDNLSVNAGGNDTLSGGAGDDVLMAYGIAGNGLLSGGAGDDNIMIGEVTGTCVVRGGAGVDILEAMMIHRTDAMDIAVMTDATGQVAVSGIAQVDVRGVELFRLWTGAGDDRAFFSNTGSAGSQSWDGGDGIDHAVLDFSGSSDSVTTTEDAWSVYYRLQAGAHEFGLDYVEQIVIRAGTGNDLLYRGSGNNTFVGNAGDDSLTGGTDSDRLVGGTGNDLLDGGDGADTFVFGVRAGASDADHVVAFESGLDRIELYGAAYAALEAGAVSADAFRIGTQAADAADRLIYDADTGTLYYDADGDGSTVQLQIAVLDNKASLSAGDFLVA